MGFFGVPFSHRSVTGSICHINDIRKKIKESFFNSLEVDPKVVSDHQFGLSNLIHVAMLD